MSTSRILTTEYIAGIRVNNKRGMAKLHIDPEEICHILYEAYAEMIFKMGLFMEIHMNQTSWLEEHQKDSLKWCFLITLSRCSELSDEFRTEFSNFALLLQIMTMMHAKSFARNIKFVILKHM
jgi:hypothetical protein